VEDIGTVKQSVEDTPRGRVARLELSNPKKLNAVSPTLILALHGRATQLAGDKDLRAVILTGEGARGFAAGADIGTLAKLDTTTGRKFITALHEAIDAVRRIPVPVVAMLRGPCLGGAMEIVWRGHTRLGESEPPQCTRDRVPRAS